jgi:flagellar biosynthesis protein FlhG
MLDQAQGLRALVEKARPTAPISTTAVTKQRAVARTLAITSGKGGVGKTCVSVHLALAMARAGQRVVLVDADLGLANAHIQLGIDPPVRLEHVLTGEASLKQALFPIASKAMLLAGGADLNGVADLNPESRTLMVSELSKLDKLADTVILDTGAGIGTGVLSLVTAASEVLVVATPDPTSVTDAYSMIKAILRERPDASIQLMINMASSEQDAIDAAGRIQRAVSGFLGYDVPLVGWAPVDPALKRAIFRRKPSAVSDGGGQWLLSIERIASTLGYHPGRLGGVSGLIHRVTRRTHGEKTKSTRAISAI